MAARKEPPLELPLSFDEAYKDLSSQMRSLHISRVDEMPRIELYLDQVLSIVGMELAERERIKTLNLLASRFNTVLYTRSDTSELKGAEVRGGVKTHTEMPKIFKLSRINLNITIRPIESGLPLRIFDIMGSGGFVLTNYQPEIAELFEVGRELEVYTDHEELMDKCAYYLEHEEERRKIAENGYKRVSEQYTYEKRVMEMLNLILGEA